MAIVFTPVVMPSDMNGQTPGRVVPCLLRTIYMPGFGSVDFHHSAADAFECLMIACKAATGYTLSSTGGGRTYQQCVDVFHQRYTLHYLPGRNVLTNRRTGPDGRRYYLRKGMFPVAGFTNGIPDSNHAKMLANDLAWFLGPGRPLAYITTHLTYVDKSDPQKPVTRSAWQWIVDHAMEYGLSWEGARPGEPGWEAHHLRYVTGDHVPQKVRDMKAWFAAAAGTNAA